MMPNKGRDLDGSHGGAYQPLPFSIWGSFLASKAGFLHSDAQAGAALSERSPMVDLELT